MKLTVAGMFCIAACNSNPSGGTSTTESTRIDSSISVTKTTMAGNNTADVLKPSGPRPVWAPDIKPPMQAVLEKLESYHDEPITSLTAVKARKNHTLTDAVNDLINEKNIPMPVFNVDTMGKEIPVTNGSVRIRVYTPQQGEGPFPVIVYYHGGGFVIANVNVYDASARALADKTGAVVVSVAYRLAPEHKFPTAHNDSFDAYKWVVKNAANLKGDPKMIALAGESAGGNLAVATAIAARDKGMQLPVHILSIYPIASADMFSPSYNKYVEAKPLDKAMMMWFTKNYTNELAEAKDPRLNLVDANLKGLPGVTIINAELDPLLSDGQVLAEKLKAAGVSVNRKVYNGVTHEFFGLGAILPDAVSAEDYAASELKSAFKK